MSEGDALLDVALQALHASLKKGLFAIVNA